MSMAGLHPPATGSPKTWGLRTQIGGPLWLAALATPVLFLLLLAWAAMTPLQGAVIVHGTAVPRGENRQIQHLDGGIIAGIHVANGDHVTPGQLLITLDPTVLRTTEGILESRLAEALARRARLRAEAGADLAQNLTQNLGPNPLQTAPLPPPPQALRGDLQMLRIDPDDPALALLQAGAAGPDLAVALQGQGQIHAARSDVRRGESAQMDERIAQLQGQTAGLDGLITAKEAQIRLMDEDIHNLESLVREGLAVRPRLLEAQRERSALLGELASHRADRAGLANSIREARLQLARSESSFREQVATDLRETESQIAELVPQIVTTRAQLDRVALRAPVAGIVHELQPTTLGGVVTPGQTLLEIVPEGESLEYDMRLDPRAIDDVHPGQRARIVFPGLRGPGTPDLYGDVVSISPSTVEDPRSGAQYYRLRLALDDRALAQLPSPPAPGTPVEAYLETGAHRALDWLLKPLIDHLGRAFRES